MRADMYMRAAVIELLAVANARLSPLYGTSAITRSMASMSALGSKGL